MARTWQVVIDYFSRSNKRQTTSCKVWTTNSIKSIWYLVHYKPEFFLVNNSSHIVSECPRASGNGSLLGHIQLARRTIKRKSHFDQTFSKKKKARVFVFICQATINNTLHGVGTSVMCGFYGCVSNNEMLWQIFSSKLEVITVKPGQAFPSLTN